MTAGIPSSGGPVVSVVVPLHDEEGNVPLLVSRLHTVLSGQSLSYEIILVDDGSRDRTWSVIQEMAEASPGIVRGQHLSRNFGHQAALLAGLSTACGNAVITMDGDLQHPPELIPTLLRSWRSGFLIVKTQRQDSAATSAFKRLSSHWFYRLFSMLAEVDLEFGSSDFYLLDRRVVREILRLRDSSLFLRGTVEWVGFRKTRVAYNVAARFTGRSKYNLRRMCRFAGSAIVSHSTVPLRIGIWIGGFTCLLALGEIFYATTMSLAGRTVPGWASILIIQSFFFGVLFVLLGIVGIYLAAMYRMLQSRPHFIVADTVATKRSTEAVLSSYEVTEADLP